MQDNRREIRSYVVRGGRLTPSQSKALETQWPDYGLELEDGELHAGSVFGREAPLVLEIGFGMGGSLLEMARTYPEKDFVGIEVHPPGVGTILRGIASEGLHNIRIYQADAKEVLRRCIKQASVDKLQIFFPDPWHKKRHHKRRLIQGDFVQELRPLLKPGGELHLATDWENYAEQMMEVMTGAGGYENIAGQGQFCDRHDRPETKFERRGLRLGHGVWDLRFRRVS